MTVFATPGPGTWEIESSHMTGPISRWMAAVYPAANMRGFRESTSRYGVLFSHVDVEVIAGFLYGRARIVGTPPQATGHPPKLVLQALMKLHPELRARTRRCKEAFERRLWREDVKRWDVEWKPEVARTNRALQAVAVETLSDEALADHLEKCRAAVDYAIYRHHSLNMCNLLPVGDFLAHVVAWTGCAPQRALEVLSGASAVSCGQAEELERVRAALSDSAAGRALLTSNGAAQSILDELAVLPGAAGAAVRDYVDAVGPRILGGYDVADKSAAEVPELMLEAIRCALAAAPAVARSGVEQKTAALRDSVPAQHCATFDELLAEARFAIRIRDERGYHNDAWSTGIARRALLEAGRRFVERKTLELAEHAVDLTPTEVDARLRKSAATPSASEVAAIAKRRTTLTLKDAPARLGPPPGPRPPLEWFPRETQRALRALDAMLAAMFDVAAPSARTSTTLRGLAASPGTAEGPARVILDPSGFARVKRGDVLIARVTSPTYNVLLPIVAGIVTDRGGLLSHAAIVARESGLPAVVGTGDATTAIPDGARVRVDGTTGEVVVLA